MTRPMPAPKSAPRPRAGLRAVGGLLALLGLGAPAEAAEVFTIESAQCEVLLSGEIVPGDADRLAAVAPDFGTICLDSPGGSFAEAVAIARLIRERYLGTYVGTKSICLSSCAVIFMFGNEESEVGPMASRTMHVGARIGFHRPEYTARDGVSYTADNIDQAFDAAMSAVWDFLQLANERNIAANRETVFPPDLFEQMIARKGSDPDDFFYIDEVEQVVKWDIRLDGVRLPDEPGTEALYNICNNHVGQMRNGEWFAARSADRIGRDTGRAPVTLLAEPDPGDGHRYHQVRSDFHVEEVAYFCTLVTTPRDGAGNIPHSVCATPEIDFATEVGQTCASDWTDLLPVNGLMIFPKGTRIVDATARGQSLAASGPSTAKTPAATLAAVASLRDRCLPKPGTPLRIIGVEEYATLRETNSYQSPVTARATPAARLSFAGDIRFATSNDGRACVDLCAARNAHVLTNPDARALDRCFADGLIWYKVQKRNGKSGWTSGQYLETAG